MATGDRLPLSSCVFLSAVSSGQVDVEQKILAGESRRNDINVLNDWGDTALLIATQLGYLTIYNVIEFLSCDCALYLSYKLLNG